MIHWHDSIDSTMHEAARLAAAGSPHLTAVAAHEQTAGIGRHGHSWHSEKDSGLYVSFILRLELQNSDLPVLTLALGLAAAEAIERETNLHCDLRWPNDVLVGGRKVCGILTQLYGSAVVAGIGINVNHSAFPPDLQPLATSLRIAARREFDKAEILNSLIASIQTHCDILQTRGARDIIHLFTRASSYVVGRRVRLEDTGERGSTAGLDASGFLMLKKDDGRLITIYAGGVRPE
jgi:BirA family transcriptional regulator, biotin operon repressor / biotin---[acetyl-CoA-carboxylase] ligase